MVFLLLLLIGCRPKLNKSISYDCGTDFNFDLIEAGEKLRSKDTLYAYCLIGSLKDTLLSDCEFEERLAALSDYLDFQFCWLDCQDVEWLERSVSRRDSIRKVIVQGYECYRSSCLFMADFEHDICSEVDLYDYCNIKLITSNEYQIKLKEAFKQICRDCR